MEISEIIHLLGDLLGEVISSQESVQTFELEERIRGLAKARRGGDAASAMDLIREIQHILPDQARAIAAAFCLYLDLVNLAEEHYRVSLLRQEEHANDPQPAHDSIADHECAAGGGRVAGPRGRRAVDRRAVCSRLQGGKADGWRAPDSAVDRRRDEAGRVRRHGGLSGQGLGVFLFGEGQQKYFVHHGHNSPGANCVLIGSQTTGQGAVIMTNGMRGIPLAVQIVSSIAREYGWGSPPFDRGTRKRGSQ